MTSQVESDVTRDLVCCPPVPAPCLHSPFQPHVNKQQIAENRNRLTLKETKNTHSLLKR